MNSLNIESIYFSITGISDTLPSGSSSTAAAIPLDDNDITNQLQHLTIHNSCNNAAEVITFPTTNGINSCNGIRHQQQYLQDDGFFNQSNEIAYSTTSVKEMSNCSASCSHSSNSSSNFGVHDLPRSSKRFRPHLSRRLDSSIPRKSLDASSVRKKIAPSKQPRQRATSFGSLQLAQGKFGAVCRKMFGQQRRRKSFSISSKSSSFDADIAEDPTSSSAMTSPSDPQSSNSSNGARQKGCGHEATSPDVSDFPVIENGEIDELAEYFEHFVNVHRKMSALAESMYV